MRVMSSEPNMFKHNGVTAHRGNSSEYPENTIAAFQSALSLGVDWIELDIHRTSDGQIVVTHDAGTKRVGDIDLQIGHVRFQELTSADVAYQFRSSRNLTLAECPSARIPLLSDVIQLILQQNQTRISLQPKANCIKEALTVVKELKAEKWIGFNDDDLRTIREVRRHAESVPLFWERPAGADIDEDLHIAEREVVEALVINHNGITKPTVDKIHQGGLQVGAWTVNKAVKMKMLLGMGVDRIYTDKPRLLLQLRRKIQKTDVYP